MSLNYETLKATHREVRDAFPEALAVRTHRSLSWLHRAESEDDLDAKFIFLWIAFNAAYANEIHDRRLFGERRMLVMFLNRLIDSDEERKLYHAVWDHFPRSIRLLIDNKFVFQPFWDYQNGLVSDQEWKKYFSNSKRQANRALGKLNTKKVIAVMFDRLYVLRNQIVHGGSTWNSGINRAQVRDGVRILEFVVPLVIELMMSRPNQLWGEACYPVVR